MPPLPNTTTTNNKNTIEAANSFGISKLCAEEEYSKFVSAIKTHASYCIDKELQDECVENVLQVFKHYYYYKEGCVIDIIKKTNRIMPPPCTLISSSKTTNNLLLNTINIISTSAGSEGNQCSTCSRKIEIEMKTTDSYVQSRTSSKDQANQIDEILENNFAAIAANIVIPISTQSESDHVTISTVSSITTTNVVSSSQAHKTSDCPKCCLKLEAGKQVKPCIECKQLYHKDCNDSRIHICPSCYQSLMGSQCKKCRKVFFFKR